MALFNSPFSGIGDALRGLNPFGGLLGGGGSGGGAAVTRNAPPAPAEVIRQIFQPQGPAETATPASAAPRAEVSSSGNSVESYIRQAARARGIDEKTALAVARSEGGLKDPTRQSLAAKGGRREPSYGPYQLLIGGGNTGFPEGLGNRALKAGIDPRDPAQWKRGVDFALDMAKQEGWGAWYGAKKIGITGRMGIGGQPSAARPEQVTRTYDNAPVDRGPRGTSTASPAPADNWAGLRPGEALAASDEANSGRPGPYQRKRSAAAAPSGVGPELPQTAPPEGRDPVDFALGAIRKAKTTRSLRSLGPAATISVLQALGRESRAAKVGGGNA